MGPGRSSCRAEDEGWRYGRPEKDESDENVKDARVCEAGRVVDVGREGRVDGPATALSPGLASVPAPASAAA